MNTPIIITNEGIAPKEKRHILSKILCLILLLVAFLCFFAARWYTKTYGDTGFDSILFTLFSNLQATESGLIADFMLRAAIPTLLLSAAAGFLLFVRPKKKRWFYPVKHIYMVMISLVLAVALLVTAGVNVNAFNYIYSLTHQSTIFTDEYIDPDSVNITFPEKKRNLIYIFLESMETTYLSKEQGGAIDDCLTPELYSLAAQNINFSHNEDVGGFLTPTGATWTVAAMTAQTAGIPLKAPGIFERNSYGRDSFLPGATSITNILKDNGYYQALMFGSDDVFANRDVYFKDHGIDVIYDLDTARSDGLIPEDYYVWWGMEDKHLFDYAKQKLPEVASQGQPFAFTMLTVDTHHVAGYKCELCLDTYEEQYENVISCSSRQVASFIDWIKTQSFYEDTTIVICGDHLTMDSDYIKRNVESGYEQHVYNCILNSAVTSGNYKNRVFSGMDLFPTTLAALGCEIPGNRLGLGTNLFSDAPTLIEKMGYDAFNDQLSMSSSFYLMNFVMNQEER